MSVMEVTEHTISFTVAKLPNDKYVAVCNLGGFTLRGSVASTYTDAVRSLFQMIGGASGYSNPDADIAVALALSGTTIQEVGTPRELAAKNSRKTNA